MIEDSPFETRLLVVNIALVANGLQKPITWPVPLYTLHHWHRLLHEIWNPTIHLA